MKIKKLDGIIFDKMLRNGLAALREREAEVNALNVFPVADGDTATNMCHTLENGLAYVTAVPPMGAYLKQLSNGMLLGARGNSGVILSQIFSGIFQELTHCGGVNASDLKNALIRGYKTAYSTMEEPAEGTILTVAREGIEHIRGQVKRDTTVDMLLAMYLAEMKKTLPHTTEMLPVLKDAEVIDSGALGYIIIVEGMVKLLRGEVLDNIDDIAPIADRRADAASKREAVLASFDEDSVFEDGYCMEFILQRLNREGYSKSFKMDDYVNGLKRLGTSIATVRDGKRIKVHIHTFVPAKVIVFSQRYGEFLDFKLDNMDVQRRERMEAAVMASHKKLAIVCVAGGEGMKKLFSELGADFVIDGGSSMNTPAKDFVEIFKRADADGIVVLPNDKNIIPAAEQAAALSGISGITVLPSAGMAEGYFALAMDVPGSDDADYRLGKMREGIEEACTIYATTASRDYSYHEISCRAGDRIALLDGELVSVHSDMEAVIVNGLKSVPDIEDKETCVIFRGESVTDEMKERLSLALDEAFPMMDKEFIDGGQGIYDWILGVL